LKAAAGQKKREHRKKNALTQNTKGKPNPTNRQGGISYGYFCTVLLFIIIIIIKHMAKGTVYCYL